MVHMHNPRYIYKKHIAHAIISRVNNENRVLSLLTLDNIIRNLILMKLVGTRRVHEWFSGFIVIAMSACSHPTQPWHKCTN